ncbi:MFS transporter [Scleromatobacter humisilvae]|uniref:MFS transporter n=1 Tax=Scleromatobacter humisilvae TaxID=2897159 RepID=A0A9X1YM83_9BURK|nr:MFS transporter [Scleromatobacter humisilvae]MCK9687490.1 MFS transporter [Scleromatobacter humisilvae]
MAGGSLMAGLPTPDGPSPAAAATPFGRLVGALIASYSGAFITQVVPPSLLLAIHLSAIAGRNATAAFSLVIGLGGVFALIANPLGGRLSDRTVARFGRRRTWILAGGFGSGLAIVVLAFTTQAWEVAAIWCVVQVLVNAQFAASAASAVDQLPPDRRGTASGVIGFVAAAAPVLGLVAVSAAAGRPTLQWIVVGAAAAACAVVAVILLRDPRHVPAQGAEPITALELLQSFWVDPRRHPAFGWAWLVRFLISCTIAGSSYNVFLLVDRFRFAAKDTGPVVLQLTLVMIVPVAAGCFLFGWLSDRLRRQKPFVVGGGLVSAAGLALLAFAPTLPLVFVATAIIGVGYGMFLATDFALCLRVLPNPEALGKDLAVLSVASALPASFVPFIAPALLALGGFGALYMLLAVFGVVGAIAVLRIPEIGREGDPRYAPITRGRPARAVAAGDPVEGLS